MAATQIDEGWKWLFNSPKWHYFIKGKSLCGRWLSFGGGYQKGNDDSPDNCKACAKALKKLKA
jgi:hypothetical protein